MSRKKRSTTYDDAFEVVLTTHTPPTLSFPSPLRGPLNTPNTVRIYKESPEAVALQVRLTRHYAHTSLNRDEALTLANALQHYAEKLQ